MSEVRSPASWTGGTNSRWALPVAVVLIGAGVVASLVQLLSGLVLIFAGAVCAEFTSVQVRIDRAGVRIAPSTGWPVVRIPIERITSASAVRVRPIAWGGWGYRGSLTLFRRAAWVLRAGEGLRLELQGGRVFGVTVDDAAGAAAVVNGLRAGSA